MEAKKASPGPEGAKKTATRIARAALEKNAGAISVLDVRGLIGYTDFVVICQAASDRQVRAVADNVILKLDEAGSRPYAAEGYDKGSWILLDYSDVIAHIFLPGVREFYDLDGLWTDAKKVPGWEDEGGPAGPAEGPDPIKRKRQKKS